VPKKDLEGGAGTTARTGSGARKGGVPEVESPKIKTDETVVNEYNASGEGVGQKKTQKPQWLKKLEEGNEFNRKQTPNYPHNEVYIDKADGSGYYRVDSYNPRTGEIV
jgi:hypothetical protein